MKTVNMSGVADGLHSTKKFRGTVRGTRQRFGFLNVTGHEDIFIKPQEMDKVFAGDLVEITVENYGTKEQNVNIDEVIESNFTTCMGVYVEDNTGAYVFPDDYGFNRGIRIPKAYRKRARNGDYVKAEIIEHPFKSRKPKAKVVDVVGSTDNTGVEVDYFLSKNNISTRLTQEVKEESADLIANYDLKKISNKRKNLCKLDFITIDGENTVDIDDAIYVQKLKNKWKVLVAISDVSEFIKEGSKIDDEAYERTSTVYLIGRTIPMLPAEFAHEYLSLKQNEKRPVLVADMTLDLNGKMIKSDFYEAMIESKARLTYNDVEKFIETKALDPEFSHVKEQVSTLYDLHKLLRARRRENYIIPAKRFDYKYILDEQRHIENIEMISQQNSYRMVEEVMLLANRCAAKFIKNHKSAIFKGQDGILEGKKKYLSQYLKQFVFFENEMFENFHDFKELYKMIDDHHKSEEIKQFMNLSFKKSEYLTEAKQHFVMGFDEYTYFTSPIRRYMDIIIHRIIKSKINKKKFVSNKKDSIKHFAEKENDIQLCYAGVENWLKSIYIKKHEDVEFTATITNVSVFGLNVKIDINGIQGFIPVSNITNSRNRVFKIDDFEVEIEGRSFKINEKLSIKLKEVQEGHSIIFNLNE